MNRAILIREKVTRLVKLLTEKKVQVTQRGSRAYVSYDQRGLPRVVNIPYIPDDASEEYLNAIEGFLDHEVGHVLFTDHNVLAEAKKLGVKQLHNIVEDTYVERMMEQHFRGSGMNLRNVGEFFLKSYTEKKMAEDPDNAEAYLIVPMLRAFAGQSVYQDYMSSRWGLVADLKSKIETYAKSALPTIDTSRKALEVTLELRKLIDGEEREDEAPEPPASPEGGEGKVSASDRDESEQSDESEHEPDEGGGAGADDSSEDPDQEPELEESLPSEGDSEPGDSEPGEDTSSEGEDGEIISDEGDSENEEGGEEESETYKPGDEGGDQEDDEPVASSGNDDVTTSSGKNPKAKSDFSSIEDKIEDFDEALSDALTELASKESMKSDYLVYTTDMDKIEPLKVGDDGEWDESLLKRMQDDVDHLVGPLQKDLERAIEARSRATWSAGHRSGRMHGASLSRLRFGDDRIFRRKHETRTKDVAVELVVDCSGSMSGAKILTAAQAAYGLASVLDRMQIANEVIGFTTGEFMPKAAAEEADRLGVYYARYKALYIPVLKSFGERMSTETKKRFAALPYCYWYDENVDGESVLIGAQRLAQRKEARKILIVLSDGQPSAPGDTNALRRHLKESVLKIESSGIDVLGLGIMSSAPSHYYPKYVLLNNIADLPTTVIAQIKRLLMQ